MYAYMYIQSCMTHAQIIICAYFSCRPELEAEFLAVQVPDTAARQRTAKDTWRGKLCDIGQIQ